MESLDSRKKTTNKIIDDINKLGDKVQEQSDRVHSQAIDTILDKNESLKPFVLASIVNQQITNAVRRIIVSTDDSFEDIVRKIQKGLAEGYEISLSTANIKAISRTKSAIIDKLVSNTDMLKSDIKVMLYANIGRGVPQRQLVKMLKELYPTYARNAGTIINTGLAREYQDINTTKFAEVGFRWYIWAGPNDKLTRDFPCKHWVNHKFPASQLDTLRATRQSLWNCRHSIIPITKEEAKDYPTGNISFKL